MGGSDRATAIAGRLDGIGDLIQAGIAVYDGDGRLVYANPAARASLAASPEVAEIAREGRPVRRRQVSGMRVDAEPVLEAGTLVAVVVTVVDETEPLAGQADRRRAGAALEAEVERTRRYGGMLSVALLEIAPPLTEPLLPAVAAVVRGELRTTDLAARLSGEQFLLVMPGTAAAEAAGVLERLAGRVAEAAPVRVGAGVTQLVARDGAPDLLARAETLLERAGAGGNRVVTG